MLEYFCTVAFLSSNLWQINISLHFVYVSFLFCHQSVLSPSSPAWRVTTWLLHFYLFHYRLNILTRVIPFSHTKHCASSLQSLVTSDAMPTVTFPPPMRFTATAMLDIMLQLVICSAEWLGIAYRRKGFQHAFHLISQFSFLMPCYGIFKSHPPR